MSNEIKEPIEEEIKENFCPPCLAAIPLAFAATSAGASKAIDGSSSSTEKKISNVLWIAGVSVASIVLAALFIWWLYIRITGKKCTTCR